MTDLDIPIHDLGYNLINSTLERKLCEKSLYEFIKYGWHVLEPGNKFMDSMHLQAFCLHLEAVTWGKIRKLIVNICPGFAKPCWVDGMVDTRHGKVKLKDIVVGDEVLTHRARLQKVTAVHEQGILPLLKITTKKGKEVRVEASHPILTAKKGNFAWVQAKDLSIGDLCWELIGNVGIGCTLDPDPIINIEEDGEGECRCLTVEYDHSFIYQGIAVKNSLTACVFWPAWEWIHKPETRWLFVSYSDDFAMRDSAKMRTLIRSEWYQRHWKDNYFVLPTADTKSKFENSQHGFRHSTSIQGGGTGSRADRVVQDDLLKIEESYSQTERDKVNRWHDEVGSMRGSDPRTSSDVVVHQRLHEDDITGHLLKRGGHVHFFVPLEFDPDRVCETPLWKDPRTIPGESCWPERFTPEIIADKKKILGFHAAAAQLQQHPQSVSGGIFRKEWFTNFIPHLPKQARRVRGWDLACLVAGTMIETINGPVAIEDIKKGDLVLTRQGCKEVTWSGLTKTVEHVTKITFSNGMSVTGTGDHKIWDEKRGWSNIDDINGGCYDLIISKGYGVAACQQANQAQNVSNSTASFIEDSQERNIITLGEKTNLGNISMIRYIEPSGGFTTDQYLMGMTSITKIGTSTITTFPISNACLDLSMQENTVLLTNGIKSQRLNSKGRKLGRSNGKTSRTKITHANFVADCLGQESQKYLNSAQNYAAEEIIILNEKKERKNKKNSTKNARYARRNSLVLGTLAPRSAESSIGLQYVLCAGNNSGNANKFNRVAVSVADKLCIGGNGGINVYDLTVKDAHEFFANGILVHNSTASKTACYTASVLLSVDVNGRYYIEEVMRGQWNPHERDQIMKSTAYADRAKYGAVTTIVEREGGSSGKDQELALTKLLYGFEVWFEHPTGPKEARIMPFASQLGGGNVFFPEDAPWFADYMAELCLIMGTKITTSRGDICIEHVKVSDLVLTRKGFKKVIAAAKTGEDAKVITAYTENSEITGTPNHPIFTVNEGFVPLGLIEVGHMVLVNEKGFRYSVVQDVLEEETRWPVYNLEVEDCHEYFANGILVHNCAFPLSDFKDMTDATSACFNHLAKSNWYAPVSGSGQQGGGSRFKEAGGNNWANNMGGGNWANGMKRETGGFR